MKAKPANEEVYSNYSKQNMMVILLLSLYFVHTKRTEPQPAQFTLPSHVYRQQIRVWLWCDNFGFGNLTDAQRDDNAGVRRQSSIYEGCATSRHADNAGFFYYFKHNFWFYLYRNGNGNCVIRNETFVNYLTIYLSPMLARL